MANRGTTKSENAEKQGSNKVRLVGIIASATISRNGTLARRIEIPGDGAREIIDIECEKSEIFPVFRALRVKQWVSVEGRIRRRFWRTGANLASRSYVEVLRIHSR